MKKIHLVLWYVVCIGLVSLLAGCASGAPVVSTVQVPLAQSSAEPGINPTPTADAPTLSPRSTAAFDQPVIPAEPWIGPLSVRINTPQDDAVVSSPLLEISGEADEGIVLSINDEIVLVGKDRSFQVQLQLDEGLNVIEVTASDLSGKQETGYLTLTFDPPSP